MFGLFPSLLSSSSSSCSSTLALYSFLMVVSSDDSSSSSFSSAYSNTHFNRLPPRRGQIKARIFKSLIMAVVGAVHSRRTTTTMVSGDSSYLPTTQTPPASSYNSDGTI